MYTVNGTEFASFTQAIQAAKAIGADVLQADNGARRWTPAPAPSAKKTRMYRERLAAYKAQQEGPR